mmetsp:Transcript_129454/g.413784  ORF Transcript_129454/g.413784 Transcript_129454/m.413784 type:complete len:219 (+) Transcript_129454:1009-1665(+)
MHQTADLGTPRAPVTFIAARATSMEKGGATATFGAHVASANTPVGGRNTGISQSPNGGRKRPGGGRTSSVGDGRRDVDEYAFVLGTSKNSRGGRRRPGGGRKSSVGERMRHVGEEEALVLGVSEPSLRADPRCFELRCGLLGRCCKCMICPVSASCAHCIESASMDVFAAAKGKAPCGLSGGTARRASGMRSLNDICMLLPARGGTVAARTERTADKA